MENFMTPKNVGFIFEKITESCIELNEIISLD